jgi:two-component system NarL family response regulator
MSVRVALADDHRMVRDALVMLLAREPDIEVTGAVGDGESALELVRKSAPDVLVVDIAMPNANGIDVTRTLKRELPALKVLVLSAYMDKRFVHEALRAGAAGYVAKAAASSELPRAIRAVAEGQNYLSPEITAAVVDHLAPEDASASRPVSVLSAREREVLRLVAEGVRSAAIARRLGISEATVEVHRRNVMRKLDLRSVAELTKYAVREGITTL